AVWEAFMDYSFHSDSLSRIERQLIRLISSGSNDELMKKAAEFGFLNPDFTLKKSREREEFEEKMKDLGIRVPWV
ncbi:MAG TPA: thymidylate synthase (FAD), partial [Leptospiraceae bacterium]|nr:thymidylate synthase (FAD) [Leptospiraceae bacterium]